MRAGIIDLTLDELREILGFPDDVTVEGARWDLPRQRLRIAVESERLDVSETLPGEVAPTLDGELVCDDRSVVVDIPLRDRPGRCVE